MKKLNLKINNLKETSQIYTDNQSTFTAIKMLMFSLPIKQRLEIAEEIMEKDWQLGFDKARKTISNELKKAGYKASDVPRLIEEYRKSKK